MLPTKALAASSATGGRISIHTRGLAAWLHEALPRTCPKPRLAEEPVAVHRRELYYDRWNGGKPPTHLDVVEQVRSLFLF